MKHYMNAKKQYWLDRAIATHQFHVEHLKVDCNWRVQDTADELQRAIGSISQDLLLADWLKTHENKIKSFTRRTYALEWIADMKKGMRLSPL